MSKLEEKFKQLEIVLFEHDLYPPDLIPSGKMTEYSAKECVEITEQECIGFAEWVISQEEFEGDYTIKELFQLYQKSKENEI